MQDSPIEAGSVINSRYRVVRLLGTGSFGAVYLGMDLREKGSLWALKEVMGNRAAFNDHSEFLLSFRNEARILMSLSHPGIPCIIDFFISGGRGYLVMERVEGLTLEEVAANNKKPLREEEVISWSLCICDTLHYLHTHDPAIIFRDLKPSNVMLTMDERVILIDFGIARFYDPGKRSDTVPLGTPGYSPPEQYGRDQTTPASDLYALGTTMYYLLTLQDMAAFKFKFPPVRTLNPQVSPLLEKVLSRCLEINPAQRYESARELKRDLSAAREAGGRATGFLGRFLKKVYNNRHSEKR